MTSVLIVEDDQQLRSAVVRDLVHRGFDVTSVACVEDALRKIERSVYDVVLTDLRMGERDGIDLLTELNRSAPATRPILMSAYATARDHKRAMDLGAVQVLCKPFSPSELIQAIQQAVECANGFRGSVHGLSLLDMLQMFHFARRSISLRLTGSVQGEVHICDGEIVHAVRGELTGEDALKELIALPSGSIQTATLECRERTITRPFESLVLDMLREVDESRVVETPSDDPFGFDEWDVDSEPSGRGVPAANGPATGEVSDTDGASPEPPSTTALALRKACEQLLSTVDRGVGAAIIDTQSERLLAQEGMGNADRAEEKFVAMLMSLLNCESIGQLDALTSEDAFVGAPVLSARLASKHFVHLVATIRPRTAAVILVIERGGNAAMAWAQLKTLLPQVEACLT